MNVSSLSYEARSHACRHPLAKRLLQLMTNKQTNLSVSADVTSAKALLTLANAIGPDICVLKTHIDIIDDFTPALTERLRELADRHEFLLFEDRKFADIGHTVMHQYAGGIYRIADWADITNAHALPGPGIVQGLAQAGQAKQRGLLLLAEMSSAGHLMDKAYVQQTLRMAQEFPDFVMGFITQHALTPEPHWLNFTPGIKLTQEGDTLGQQYVTPEQAIVDHGTDIIIVGRGILKVSHPQAEAARYRQAGWDAYQQRLLVLKQ